MLTSNIQDCLSWVEKPSRYLGTEINSVFNVPRTLVKAVIKNNVASSKINVMYIPPLEFAFYFCIVYTNLYILIYFSNTLTKVM